MVDRFELCLNFKQAVREAATICPRPCKLTFDILTLKVVFESRDASLFIDLGPMYATDRRQTDAANALFGKIGVIVSEDVILQLIKSTDIILCYNGVDACALTKAVYV